MVGRVLVLALSLVVVACQIPGPASRSSKPVVVVTHSILGDLARNVAGERVEVVVLVPAGADAHTFQPSPAEATALARATLVLENGLGFEPWLDKLYESSRSKARRVILTDDVHPLEAGEHAAEGGGTPSAHEGELDPHVWHDVAHALHIVGVVREALATTDPAGAESYRANADRYSDELGALDAWIVEQITALPMERRKLVTTHDTFRYFAARYDFTVVGTALGSSSTETSDPSAAEVARLVDTIRSAGVPSIFVEDVGDARLMERIAVEAGVRIAPPLYTDALSPPGGEADTYIKMMRHNVATIVATLRG
jgi:zinc/manganese transport system substrate-binding protein